MKAYIITEEQMKSLGERLELSSLRQQGLMSSQNPDRIAVQEIHRSFVFVVQSWINEMGK